MRPADPPPPATPPAATAPLTFAAFLEKMRCAEATDIVKAIKAFLTEFAALQPDAERDSERVQARFAAPSRAPAPALTRLARRSSCAPRRLRFGRTRCGATPARRSLRRLARGWKSI